MTGPDVQISHTLDNVILHASVQTHLYWLAQIAEPVIFLGTLATSGCTSTTPQAKAQLPDLVKALHTGHISGDQTAKKLLFPRLTRHAKNHSSVAANDVCRSSSCEPTQHVLRQNSRHRTLIQNVY